jgi:hypothetical protein
MEGSSIRLPREAAALERWCQSSAATTGSGCFASRRVAIAQMIKNKESRRGCMTTRSIPVSDANNMCLWIWSRYSSRDSGSVLKAHKLERDCSTQDIDLDQLTTSWCLQETSRIAPRLSLASGYNSEVFRLSLGPEPSEDQVGILQTV